MLVEPLAFCGFNCRHCEFGFCRRESVVRVATWTLVSRLRGHELQDVGRTFLYLRLQASRSDFVSSPLAVSPQPRLPLDRAVDSEEPPPLPELSG